jgi:hypothetical protein
MSRHDRRRHFKKPYAKRGRLRFEKACDYQALRSYCPDIRPLIAFGAFAWSSADKRQVTLDVLLRSSAAMPTMYQPR